jgi:hypothetical protein
MSSATPQELTAASVIARVDAGAFPRDVLITIAKGFLPLAQEDLIAVLSYLAAGSADQELAALAHDSLAEVPSRSILAFASNEKSAPEYLILLMRASEDPQVLEALIRNRAVPDSSIVDLAGRADPAVQEIIVINQARIIRAPEILDALLANPRLSAETKRRALENREEFFDKKARLEKLAEDEVAEFLDNDPIVDLLEKAAQEDQANAAAGVKPSTLPTLELEPEKKPIFQKILTMSVSEKVQLAFKGGRTERNILIRERNKLISSAVMRNPRMSETEVEAVAGMRNVDDEVLRLITTKRQWMSKYPIVLSLARNPKCPIGVVVPLINRLTLRDLKGLKDDKGVPEVVRATARKLYQQRGKK